MNNITAKLKLPSRSTIILVTILIASVLAHSVNLFGFPEYREDEGTYMSQAWSVIHTGELAPYTYWYDHAPAGWILLGFWSTLSGGFFEFGTSINSGRVFMVILHTLSLYMLYRVVKIYTQSDWPAAIAAIFYALSPLAIYYQRQVLLDNIMVFWFLLSIYLIVIKPRLTNLLLSAVAFGIAVLTKETAIIFAPVVAVGIYLLSHQLHKRFGFFLWSLIVGLIGLVYPLMALLKSELFPSSWWGEPNQHVSMWEGLQFQLGREGVPFYQEGSPLIQSLAEIWYKYDPTLVLLGFISLIGNLLLATKSKASGFFGFLLTMFVLYLVRGGVSLDWYIIPAIPLLAINVALFLHNVYIRLPQKKLFNHQITGWSSVALASIYLFAGLYTYRYFFIADLTRNQRLAIQWLQEHTTQQDVLVIDNYAFLELNQETLPNSIRAHYYWKADTDPEVKQNILRSTWENVDYILVTPGMLETLESGNLPLVSQAIQNSSPIITYDREVYPQLYHTAQIRRVHGRQWILDHSWIWYKRNFIDQQGRVIDPSNSIVTSESQSYALLRAVWTNDQQVFDQVLEWTEDNLQKTNGLFSWRYKVEGNSGQIEDVMSASDADQDIALALLLAYKKWEDPEYLTKAQIILDGIWAREVEFINGEPVLTAGDWAMYPHQDPDGFMVNPSYFAPYAYRIFAEADPDHDWEDLVDTSYRLISDCSDSESGLPADWCVVDYSGQGQPFNLNSPEPRYSFDAMRVLWRLALDYTWYQDGRAKQIFQNMSIWDQQLQQNNKIFAAYNLQGQPVVNYESLANYATLLSYYSVVDEEKAEQLYFDKISSRYQQTYWGDSQNYYDQNWVWFGLALHQGVTHNYWEQDSSPSTILADQQSASPSAATTN